MKLSKLLLLLFAWILFQNSGFAEELNGQECLVVVKSQYCLGGEFDIPDATAKILHKAEDGSVSKIAELGTDRIATLDDRVTDICIYDIEFNDMELLLRDKYGDPSYYLKVSKTHFWDQTLWEISLTQHDDGPYVCYAINQPLTQ